MIFEYFPETNSLIIKLLEQSGTDSIEIADGVIADIDDNGLITSIEFYSVNKKIDLSGIIFDKLPVSNVSFINSAAAAAV